MNEQADEAGTHTRTYTHAHTHQGPTETENTYTNPTAVHLSGASSCLMAGRRQCILGQTLSLWEGPLGGAIKPPVSSAPPYFGSLWWPTPSFCRHGQTSMTPQHWESSWRNKILPQLQLSLSVCEELSKYVWPYFITENSGFWVSQSKLIRAPLFP